MRCRTCSCAPTPACARAMVSWCSGRGCTASPTTAASTSSGAPLRRRPSCSRLCVPPVHDPIAAAEQRESLRRLVADVRRLPEQQRSALLMRELGGMAYADMACVLGVTVPAVKSLLVRARIALAQAHEARDTACSDIRGQLTLAHDRGVRPSGTARRHMRDCNDCRHFHRELRGDQPPLRRARPDARTARRARQAARVRRRRGWRRGGRRWRCGSRRRGGHRRRARICRPVRRRRRPRRDVDRGGGGHGGRGSRDSALGRRDAGASPPSRIGAGARTTSCHPVRTRHRRADGLVTGPAGVAGGRGAGAPDPSARRIRSAGQAGQASRQLAGHPPDPPSPAVHPGGRGLDLPRRHRPRCGQDHVAARRHDDHAAGRRHAGCRQRQRRRRRHHDVEHPSRSNRPDDDRRRAAAAPAAPLPATPARPARNHQQAPAAQAAPDRCRRAVPLPDRALRCRRVLRSSSARDRMSAQRSLDRTPDQRSIDRTPDQRSIDRTSDQRSMTC